MCLHYLRSLYGMNLVPDKSEFNKLMMLVVAEVADNTSHAGMRPYPAPMDSTSGSAGKVAEPSGARFKKSTIQHKILTGGLAALERCATKYLETGGGRFSSAMSPPSSGKRSKKRARGPGKALKIVLNDFRLYDNKLRSETRHLPAASLHGVKLSEDPNDPRYACGILKKRDRTEGTVSVEKIMLMHSVVKKLFKYAKRVGVDLAKSVPPPVDYVWKRTTSPRELAAVLNCVHRSKKHEKEHSDEHSTEHAGILQNLNQAEHILRQERLSFVDGKSLISFLEEALENVLRLMQKFCNAKVGADKCNIAAPSEKSCRNLVRHNRLPEENKNDLVDIYSKSHGKADTPLPTPHLEHKPLKKGELAHSLFSKPASKHSASSHGSSGGSYSHSRSSSVDSHGSQGSHGSRGSHGSHDSHDSHDSHGSHGSHDSHGSSKKNLLQKGKRRDAGRKIAASSTSSEATPHNLSDASGDATPGASTSETEPSSPTSSTSSSSPSQSDARSSEASDSGKSLTKSSSGSLKKVPVSRNVMPKKKVSSGKSSTHSASIKSGVPGGRKSREPLHKTPITSWQELWKKPLPKSQVML